MLQGVKLQAFNSLFQKMPGERHRCKPVKGVSFGLCREAPFFIFRWRSNNKFCNPDDADCLMVVPGAAKLKLSKCSLQN
jgi:hypothetical protein